MQRILLLLGLSASSLFAQTSGNQTSGNQASGNQVLATLTVADGVSRDQIMKVMPGEVRATVQMYLDGKIQQWFSKADGKGVIFVLNCKTVDEAKELMAALPLSKAKFATFEFTGIAPLKPLSLLLGPPPQ
jgi:hypothetical protein